MTKKDWLKGSYASLISNFALMLLLFSICRLVFFLFNHNLFLDTSANQIWPIFIGGVRFDISALAWANIVYIVLFILPIKFRYNATYQKVLKIFFITTNSILLFANCADFIYFKYTLRHTTSSVFTEFAGGQNHTALAAQFILDFWYIPVFWIALICILTFLYRKAKKPELSNDHRSNIFFYISSTLAFFTFIGLSIVGMRGGITNLRPLSLTDAGNYAKRPLEAAIVQNAPFCFMRTLGKQSFPRINYFSSNAELNKVFNPVETPSPKGEFKPLNVVIIIWEGLSREYVGALNKHLENGNYKGYTPYLDSLIGESLICTSVQANGRKSIESLPSVLSSIPSSSETFVLSPYSSNQVNSIGSLLKAKGYNTSFFHGAHNGSMGFQAFLAMAGFDEYYGKTEYNNDADFDGTWGIWDEPFFQYFAQHLAQKQQPFISVVFTLSSHHPYRLPKKYVDKYPEGPHPITKCISYTDYSLHRFFETVKTQPWYNNTLFVITADHSNQPLHREYETSVGQMAIPIIYFMPSGQLNGVVKSPSQQTDIMPTVLGLLNFDKPYVAFGQDVLNTSREQYACNYVNGVYQLFFNEYVLLFDGGKNLGLFNLMNDKLMQQDLTSLMPELVNKMEAKAKGFIQQYNNRMIDNCLTVDCKKYE